MKAFHFSRAAMNGLLILLGSKMITTVNSFVVTPKHALSSLQPACTRGFFQETILKSKRESAPLFSSTSTRPLYDGTNYTFPDTRTPTGVAELLEVSFVHGCMQLASGYVDVLKMFIAASVGAYEAGFSIASILEELEENKDLPNTANRPLIHEEKMLRRDWLCVIYLTLASMGHKSSIPSPLTADVATKSIPEDIKERYGEYITKIGEAFKNGRHASVSVEGLAADGGSNGELSSIEKAVLLQSLKVATLTPIVVEEAKEASGNNVKPPTPPIEGAF